MTGGTVIGVFGVIDTTLKGLGYDDPARVISIVMIIGLVLGVVGTIFYSVMVKKTKKFKLFSHISNNPTNIVTLSLFIGYLLLCLFILKGYDKLWQITLFCILFQLNYNALLPFFVVYGSQLAFPVDQASITGYLILVFHLFAFILGLILVAVLQPYR